MFDGVDSAVGDFDHLVERDEGRLQGGQLHQQLDRLRVVLLQPVDLLTSSRQTRQLIALTQNHRTWKWVMIGFLVTNMLHTF